jgi:hypothetical protein
LVSVFSIKKIEVKMHTSGDASPSSSNDDVAKPELTNGNTMRTGGQPETGVLILPDTPDAEKGIPKEEKRDGPDASPPFSIFSLMQKRFIVLIVALTTLLPPLTASIFYPVITLLARELHVSITDINLTITIYLVRISQAIPREVKAWSLLLTGFFTDHPRHCSFICWQFIR